MRRRIIHFVLAIIVLAVMYSSVTAQIPSGETRPNIILIMADDLGFSDLGCYGSEIHTPNLDRLATHGLRFSQFYNAGRCCPTRAALLTGLDPHRTGVGHMMNDYGRPGYRGNLNKECATLAELLQKAGYRTMMTGKWHLTRYTGDNEPKFNWPRSRGFDLFYGTIHGGGSYLNPVTLTDDKSQIGLKPNASYYYTDAISDRAAEYVQKAARERKPFFLYVAYTAPHWPLHVPPEMASRYRAQYATGWDELREQRHRRMISMGIVRANWPLTPRDSRVRAWEKNVYKSWQQRRMEIYAAQIDVMDQGIGRIINSVQRNGIQRNTLVMFLSDNGGCAEEVSSQWKGIHIPEKTLDGRAVRVGNDPAVTPGPETTYQSYGLAWANASNTPFRLYKHWVHEGGIATPLIVHWPEVIKQGSRITHEIGHVTDIVPTCLEAAKVRYPTYMGSYKLTPLSGASLMPIFEGKTRQRAPIFWEHEGNRAVRDGRWKLVSRYPGRWELYDMEADRTELNDLAPSFPAIVKDLSGAYETWAKSANVEQWRK